MGKGRWNGICFYFQVSIFMNAEQNKITCNRKHLKVLHRTRVVDHFEGWQDGRSGGWSGFLQEGCHINIGWTFVQLSFEELCDKQEKKAPESPLLRWRRKKGQSRQVWVIFPECNLRTREDFLKLPTARYNLFLQPWTENLLKMYLRRQADSDYRLTAVRTLQT